MSYETHGMVRFDVSEFIDWQDRKNTPASLAFIWAVNRATRREDDENAVVFGEPTEIAVTDNGDFCVEHYPRARVIWPTERMRRTDPTCRIVTDDPDLIPLWDQLANEFYGHTHPDQLEI
jgi:hypothetical protein